MAETPEYFEWDKQLFTHPRPLTDTACYKCHQELLEPMLSETMTGNCREEALRWHGTGGYFSRGVDMVTMNIVLCENCKFELLGPYIRFSLPLWEFHYARRERRDDEAIRARWRARQERRALNAMLRNKGIKGAPCGPSKI